jgi:hypothetical protein
MLVYHNNKWNWNAPIERNRSIAILKHRPSRTRNYLNKCAVGVPKDPPGVFVAKSIWWVKMGPFGARFCIDKTWPRITGVERLIRRILPTIWHVPLSIPSRGWPMSFVRPNTMTSINDTSNGDFKSARGTAGSLAFIHLPLVNSMYISMSCGILGIT